MRQAFYYVVSMAVQVVFGVLLLIRGFDLVPVSWFWIVTSGLGIFFGRFLAAIGDEEPEL